MKKRFLILAGAALIVVLLATNVVVPAFAQEETPLSEAPCGGRGGGFLPGGGSWARFDVVAEALGLTPEEFFAEMHAGKTLEEIAEEQGVEMEAVREALQTARVEAMQERIAQAVEDGSMTQEQADWMLEGIEQGFLPMGRGFDSGHGMRGGSGHGMRGGFGRGMKSGFTPFSGPSAAPGSSSL